MENVLLGNTADLKFGDGSAIVQDPIQSPPPPPPVQAPPFAAPPLADEAASTPKPPANIADQPTDTGTDTGTGTGGNTMLLLGAAALLFFLFRRK